MNVEEIQDIVEDAIMATGAYEVARRYITYRYVQSLKRTHNTTDDKILSLIECNNEEVKQENSNTTRTTTPSTCTTATSSIWTICCRTARSSAAL